MEPSNINPIPYKVRWNKYVDSRKNAIISIIKLIWMHKIHNISAERL